MKPILLHPIIFYLILFFFMVMSALFTWIVIKYWRKFTKDVLLFIDKSNRWKLIYENVKYSNEYTYNKKKYLLMDNISMLNKKGKSLFVFSEGKPAPMILGYNSSKWVDSESMLSIINNKFIQQLMKTTSDIEDKLLLFGAIGGMIAGIASVLILLKTFGVLK